MKKLLILYIALLSAELDAQIKLSEEQKIVHLICFVANLKGATFIRNGDEHKPKQAADHLAMKREKAGSRIKTAKEFIDKVATRSSLTGEVYMIRFANGKSFPAQMVLQSELKKLEEGKVELLTTK